MKKVRMTYNHIMKVNHFVRADGHQDVNVWTDDFRHHDIDPENIPASVARFMADHVPVLESFVEYIDKNGKDLSGSFYGFYAGKKWN